MCISQLLWLIRSPRLAGRFMGPSAGQLINTSTGTVQVRLQERQGVSADEAHVELKTEEGSTAARMAVFQITNHLESKMQTFPVFSVNQH